MAGLSSNPLFTRASRSIRDSAKQSFRRSDFGRLLRELEVAHQRPAAGPRDLPKLLRAYQRGGSQRLLRELARSDAGRLARDLERYARRGSLGRKIVSQVLGALGPAGQFLQALSGVAGPMGKSTSSSRARSLEAATKLLQSFGYEILPPGKTQSPEDLQRSLEAARAFLETHGRSVPLPQPAQPVAMPQPAPEATEGRSTVDVMMSNGMRRRFTKNHPIVTGKFVTCHSSNVHSYAYNVNTWELYVRFLGGEGEHRAGPGPIYQYSHVPPELFLTLLKAGSKGSWVWDNLRIRGTVSGHQFDYRLVGIVGSYVPRKATYTPEGEWYLPRTTRTNQGRVLTSARPSAPARGIPNRGRPNPPNRGKK